MENGCYCTSKTRKSESNSHPPSDHKVRNLVVIALVKLENLKAIHNNFAVNTLEDAVVIALVKLENLKAIHNEADNVVNIVPLLLH